MPCSSYHPEQNSEFHHQSVTVGLGRLRHNRRLFNFIVSHAARRVPAGVLLALQPQTFGNSFDAGLGDSHLHGGFRRRGPFVEGLE